MLRVRIPLPVSRQGYNRFYWVNKRKSQVSDIVFESVHYRYRSLTEQPSKPGGRVLNPMASTANEAILSGASESESKDALRGISLTVRPGEFVAVVGANGSGKSTMARHINALLIPVSGRVLTVGLDTSDETNLFYIRSHAGMVFQDPATQMVAGVVADDVAFGPENLNVPASQLRSRVDQALAAVDMGEYTEADPARLSGGQRQRVSIAGILAMQPKILILDEPGAMLDVRGRQSIREIVGQLNDNGLTVIWITHTMEVAATADRVIVLDRGRIALDGTPASVFADHRLLVSLGLETPFPIQLVDALARYGLVLDNTLDSDDLADQICNWYLTA
jgi:energy-coupling factor transporter ATPase